jgi:hypothetical protein
MDVGEFGDYVAGAKPETAPKTPRLPPAVKVVVTELVLGLVAHVLAEAARRLIEGRREGER